jgi:hypothetical protein
MPATEFRPPGAFLNHLGDHGGLPKKRNVDLHGNIEIHYLDLTELRVTSSVLTPFLIPKALSAKEAITEDELGPEVDDILDLATSMHQEWSVCVLGGKIQPSCNLTVSRLKEYRVAILDRQTIDAVYAAPNKDAKLTALGTALAERLGIDLLSIYREDSPAEGSRFFGRKKDVSALEASGNFAIIGNRRIGKTSLMSEVERRLRQRHRDIRCVRVYASLCETGDALIEEIKKGLVDRSSDRRTLKDIVDFAAEQTGVAVFIDEFDHFLEVDAQKNYAVTDTLRNIFHKSRDANANILKRLFVAGFRTLEDAHVRQNTPLFNFTAARILGRFTLDETREMVDTPMRHLGVPVADTDLPAQVYKETGGHPELIRICCDQILSHFDKTGLLPSPTDLMTVVFDSPVFQQKVWATFLSNTNCFEQLACYLLIRDGEAEGRPLDDIEFNINDIDRLYRRVRINRNYAEINSIVTNLAHSSVITSATPGSTKYRFSVPQLGRYIGGLDIEASVTRAVSDCLAASEKGVLAEPS